MKKMNTRELIKMINPEMVSIMNDDYRGMEDMKADIVGRLYRGTDVLNEEIKRMEYEEGHLKVWL